jgi:outer membrane lipoprotein-sorting protein
MDLLRQMAKTYEQMKTLRAEGTMTSESNSPGMSMTMDSPLIMELASPGKMRLELRKPSGGMIIIGDGQTTWMYMPQLNAYMKFSLPASGVAPARAINPMAGFNPRQLAQDVSEARVLRSESAIVNGQNEDCAVVEAEYRAPVSTGQATVESRRQTLWIDKQRLLVVRLESVTRTKLPGASAPSEDHANIRFDKLAVDEPLGADQFTFTPPAGARELRSLAVHAPCVAGRSGGGRRS